MPDPAHTKVCLSDSLSGSPVLSLFLVPEPRVPGGSILHLVEQTPLTVTRTRLSALTIPRRNPHLVDWLQASAEPAIGIRFTGYAPGPHDPGRLHEVLRDHFIADPEPMGLDADDPDELTRLELLPEHWLGARRIDDFHEYAVRNAMLAVYRHFGVDRRIPLLYHGYAAAEDGWFEVPAAEA